MALLNELTALDLLKSPKNLSAKAEALRWQNRTRFHGLTVRDKIASAYWPEFLRWVKSFILVDDKRALFEVLFPFPTPATPLLGEVQDAYMKVFDAVNPELTIDGGEGVEAGLLAHLQKIKEPDFWPDQSIAALFESHEDLLLVDVRTSETGQPEPYLTRLCMDSVISLELNDDATAITAAYRTADGEFVVVDDNAYYLFSQDKDGFQYKNTYMHGLGRCPVRKLWGERVPNHAIASASVIDEALGWLDMYALLSVCYNIFKLYGAFPIYYGAETQKLPQTATERRGAFNDDGTPDAGDPLNCKAQETAGSNFLAPGEYREMPFGSDLSVPPVGIVEPSTNTLTFHQGDIDKLYNFIKGYLIGDGGESLLMNQQINEKQATGSFSHQENVLLRLSRHLSAAREWAILTIGQMLYRNRLKSVSHSFGTKFYLETEDDLWKGLSNAKSAGAPQSIIYEKVQSIQSFRLRLGGNGSRSSILMDCEPLAEKSENEVQSLVQLGIIPVETLAVKVQFNDLIKQMEREFGVDISQIGSALPYPERINRIIQYLYSHVKINRQLQPDTNSGSTGATSGTTGAIAA